MHKSFTEIKCHKAAGVFFRRCNLNFVRTSDELASTKLHRLLNVRMVQTNYIRAYIYIYAYMHIRCVSLEEKSVSNT